MNGDPLEQAVELADQLRELANWVEEHPPLAPALYAAFTQTPIQIACSSRREIVEYLRSFAEAEPLFNRTWFRVKREFGPIRLDAYIGLDLLDAIEDPMLQGHAG